MFNVEILGGLIDQLKNLCLPKLDDEEASALYGCVATLEVSMVSISEAYLVLQTLDKKVFEESGQDQTIDPDINYLINAYTELDKQLLNGNKELCKKYLNSLKVTLNSVLKVLQYINNFEKLKEDVDKPRIILLS